ncbi:pyrroloquinoline quinone-dependent dehydrogenase [Tanticharoenia sakaeratensis]|jgi:quinoprotein glucose dehydrogenase|uniref:D-sorbitol dehydrogenase subunit SldA n=1 Tax=Tanticharoenia sakaeratensis NBRC 103193 TaxID=1231623 RepID=A0A0D6MIM0_9PROT|nr:pyrroloquinoline quinone-dependent dehydrogenase [Tanticharoenia sakaeratensis]GAN53504.1 D-sorbitol dehydrogenase subunit SldA [Tanticharoenia sakaeratensis NBRC 103193]GBQ17714.1 D-sorbitol dehydrogenase subunit SldA [Tanticharoenia sakaeratensis NBRC 103193]
MRPSLLIATALAAGLISTAHAQVASKSSSVPGTGAQEGGNQSPGEANRFAGPSPSAPQAPGVNAANLPDDPQMDMSQATPMVPQQSANPAPGDWSAYGHDDDATRYSPLDQITPANVGQLQRAFIYHTGSKPAPGQQNKWAAETTPIKVGDGLYTCSAMNDMMKLDPATGKELWRFNAGVKYHSIPYTAACKSVVYYTSSTVPEGQPCHNRILEATLDERLIEVDADTGKACEAFGFHGQINLMQGMGESVPGFVSETAPPPIVNGVIVTNQEVLDGQRRWAPSGVIRGYDAETGKFDWAWDVNRPDDHNQPGPGEHYSRGTPNSWAAMTGDNALGLVYVPTGNSAADYYSAMRTDKENAVSSAIVAIDVKTGSPRWVFQTVHKDVWDYDMGSQPTKIDFPGPNGSTPALVVPTKRGQTFVLDRATGKPLLPVEERPAPTPGVVPGDVRSPTQPWSTGMPRLGFPPLKESDMWGMSPIDQLFCRIKYRKANYVGEFTPPSIDKPWIEYPGYNGGSDWGSMAYDAKTGILIANWNNTPMYDQLVTRKHADKLGLMPIDDPNFNPSGGGAEGNGAMADTPYGIVVTPFWDQYTGMMCNRPPYGAITAIDMHTRKVLWQTPLGTARANGPWGLPTYLPLNIGTPNNGGPMITAGGLVFVAAATDNMIRAIDMKTGKTVWSDVLPGGGQATPMTYEYKGRQYVAIMAGGHHFMMTPVSDDLVVYALPEGTH